MAKLKWGKEMVVRCFQELKLSSELSQVENKPVDVKSVWGGIMDRIKGGGNQPPTGVTP